MAKKQPQQQSQPQQEPEAADGITTMTIADVPLESAGDQPSDTAPAPAPPSSAPAPTGPAWPTGPNFVIELAPGALLWQHKGRVCAIWARSTEEHSGWTPVQMTEPQLYGREIGTASGFRLQDVRDPEGGGVHRALVADAGLDKVAWEECRRLLGAGKSWTLNVYGYDVVGPVGPTG